MTFIGRMGRAAAAVVAMLLIGTAAQAADTYIGPLLLQSVGVQQTPGATGHLVGNLEVKLREPATLPTGMTCDKTYFTTKRESDPDKRLFALITAAHLAGKPVTLQISDDPSLRAYPGRCSLLWVEVLP
ncbi:hypothetical protein [Roseateles chitinivorans]|uniref:hypothetical protein n=1 Tax=Roseateles chitinivorans TaxID=2917965 RepID=UPI003D67B2F7